MKTIGLIGGMSWESTQTYYQLINQRVRDELGGLHSARLVLYSVDFAEIEALRRDYEDALQGILVAGQAEGVFALQDAKIATLAVIAMLNGVMTWYRAGGRLSLDQVEQIYWDMVRKAVSA